MSPKREVKCRVYKPVTWKWRKSPEPDDSQPKAMKDPSYQTAELLVVVYHPSLQLGAGHQSISANPGHARAHLEKERRDTLTSLTVKLNHLR